MPDESLPTGTTLLVKRGRALTPGADWHQPPTVDIAIAGDTIVGLSEGYRMEGGPAVEVIDAHDHLVLPGFVNARASPTRQ
jgi:cytosine/adenosine deaminase-related metal-dependent hydrolase